jgi:hypothetical protein
MEENSFVFKTPGGNPTIVSYNTTNSLMHFENKNMSFYFGKTL